MHAIRALGLAGAAVLMCAGCTEAGDKPKSAGATTRPAQPEYKSVRIYGVPHVRQKPDFCGEACAQMWLRKLGVKNTDQDYVFDRSGLDPLEARGCRTAELARALKQIGFKVGRVWATVPAAKLQAAMDAQWTGLHADLLRKVPSIVCMHYDDKPKTAEHFRLVLGYDSKADEVIYHEPAAENGAYRRMKRKLLLKLWPLKYSRAKRTVIRLRLDAGKIKDPAPSATFTSADYAQHIMELKEKIPPGGRFTVVVQPPFVVIGDESPAMVRRRAAGTVKWAADMLKKAYFKKDPTRILDIWLFKDKASYRKHTRGIFKDNPSTPFGYYSAAHGALIMDIATGGGTLVHEIVHPFMAANFPDCPAWFNEGLGSLYEQSGERRGKIVGFTNWRLAGLQKAIKAAKVPSFKWLTDRTNAQFYGQDPGTNYAQSRYLCYWLQQKGLLRTFYHDFYANRRADPTGFATLTKTIGAKDMAAFKKKWEAYVLKLRFR